MNAQSLNPVGSASGLHFTDSASCKRWVESLPLGNIPQAREILSAELAALRGTELAAIERLRTLETLKDSVAFVQAEFADRYAGKPLPLDVNEAESWAAVNELWRHAHSNYERCLQAYRDGDLDIAPHAPLVAMRCLFAIAAQMVEHYRVYREVPESLWRALNELYAFAEQHGFARTRPHGLGGQTTEASCVETYVETLLIYLANPYALSVRQLAFVESWSRKWAMLVGLSPQPLPSGSSTPLAVSLDAPAGAVLVSEMTARSNVRYLDLEQLSKTLRQTITLLKQGRTPAELGLGEAARQPGCENLLMLLYVQWCRAGTARGEDRETTNERVSVCFGISAAHFQVSGRRELRQPTELTAREKQDLDTFGFVPRAPEHRSAEALEVWNILNYSPSGFMCILRDPTSKVRIVHNQLVAVQRRGTRHFQVGMVQWLRVEREREIQLGVRVFPGIPQAVAVRPSNFTPESSRYEPALLLPEVPASATPATLILPPGWFQSGRFVETQSDHKQVAKLLNLLEVGSDFDRCTITLI